MRDLTAPEKCAALEAAKKYLTDNPHRRERRGRGKFPRVCATRSRQASRQAAGGSSALAVIARWT